jgi:hypothetical protein
METIYVKSHKLGEKLRRFLIEKKLIHRFTVSTQTVHTSNATIVYDEFGLSLSPDWSSGSIPLIYAAVQPSAGSLLGLLSLKKHDYQAAYNYHNENHDFQRDITLAYHISQGMLINSEILDGMEDDAETITEHAWRYYHNLGIAYFYGHPMRHISHERQKNYFEKALQLAPNKIWQAYTILHYAQLLLQHQEVDAALQILQASLSKQLGEAADKAVKVLLMNVLISKIDRKPEFRDIFTAEELLHELLAYYEEHHEYIQQALLLMDASHLADIQGYRTEAYGYLNQAISLLQREQLPQLAAQVIMQKNRMMNNWVGLVS